jgi:hypothetical protein
MDVLRPVELQEEDEAACFNRKLATIDDVAEEKIMDGRRETLVVEDAEEVEELAVKVPNNVDRGSEIQTRGLGGKK